MWMAILKPEITVKHSEKRKKNNNLLKTKRIANTKIQARWGPGFYIYLARGEVHTPAPVSYATYQAHFKHKHKFFRLTHS